MYLFIKMYWVLVEIALLSKITLSYKEVGLSGLIKFILEINFLNWNEAAQILLNNKTTWTEYSLCNTEWQSWW